MVENNNYCQEISQKELTDLLDEASIKYYNGIETQYTDTEFDLLLKRLQYLEEKNGVVYPNSPTIRVGSDLQKEFKKGEHPIPMFTIENTYDDEGLNKWVKDIHDEYGVTSFNVSIKYDGVSCELWYKGGKFFKALTRGDKIVGDDITENVKTIKNVPLVLKHNFEDDEMFFVRGEILMPKSQLVKINEQRVKDGLDIFSNTRNACTGSIKQLDPKVTASRGLIFKAWDCFYREEGNFYQGDEFLITMDEKISVLERMGFYYEPNTKPTTCLNHQVEKIVTEFKKTIDSMNLDYDYDGIVIKVNDVFIQNKIGTKDTRAIEWGIARKWNEDREVRTRLCGVDWQVGRTGVLTPVGRLEPVICDGVEISNVTLHNWDFIRQKNIKIGSELRITRSGGVIPYVIDATTPISALEVVYPKYCPACGHDTVNETDVLIKCPNEKCCAKIVGQIIHFCSKDCMDIRTIGERVAQDLVLFGIVNDVSNLYCLKNNYTPEKLAEELGEGYGVKSCQKMLDAIEESKNKPFANVLTGLSIPGVGKVVGRLLANKFKNIDGFLNADYVDLVNIDGIGDIMAVDIINWINDDNNRDICCYLKANGLKMSVDDVETKSNVEDRGIKVCFTGKSYKFKGDEVEDYLKANGFTIAGVSRSLDYLITGTKPGTSKVSKARECGVEIIPEIMFYEKFNLK